MNKSIVYLLMFVFSISLAYAVPCSWYGYVTYNGSTAADGTVIDALIGTTISGTTTVGAVQSNGYYLVHVTGNVGDSVYFQVYGNNVTQAAQTWAAGFQHPAFNLTASATANGVACPTYTGYTLPTTYNSNPGCLGGYCVHSICRAATTYCGDGYCDTGESCTSDNSACASGQACTNGCQSSGGGGGGGGGGGTTTTCTEDWDCTDWTDCHPDNTYTRTCIDNNACGTTNNKPEESRTCVYASVPEEAAPEPVQPVPAPPIQPTPVPTEEANLTVPAPQQVITLEIGIMLIIILILLAVLLFLLLKKKREKEEKRKRK